MVSSAALRRHECKKARPQVGRSSAAPMTVERSAGRFPWLAPQPQLLRLLTHQEADCRRLTDAEHARQLRQQPHALVVVVDQEPAREEGAGGSAFGPGLLIHSINMIS